MMVVVSGLAIQALALDDREKWPTLEQVRTITRGRGYSAVIEGPVEAWRQALAEADDRGTPGNGYDQPAGWFSECRRLSTLIRVAMKKEVQG